MEPRTRPIIPPRPSYFLCLLFLWLALFPDRLTAQEEDNLAGRVIVAHGSVRALAASGAGRPLARGAEVYETDTVITGAASLAQIRLADEGLLALQPDTEFAFSEFRYDGPGGAGDSAVLTLIRGGFRTVSGSIGKEEADVFRIETAYANIGIRGTTHDALIDPAGNSLLTGVSDGGTTVSNAQGSLDLGLGADFDFSQTYAGEAPRGLLDIPVQLGNLYPAALAAAVQNGGNGQGAGAAGNGGQAVAAVPANAAAPAAAGGQQAAGPAPAAPAATAGGQQAGATTSAAPALQGPGEALARTAGNTSTAAGEVPTSTLAAAPATSARAPGSSGPESTAEAANNAGFAAAPSPSASGPAAPRNAPGANGNAAGRGSENVPGRAIAETASESAPGRVLASGSSPAAESRPGRAAGNAAPRPPGVSPGSGFPADEGAQGKPSGQPLSPPGLAGPPESGKPPVVLAGLAGNDMEAQINPNQNSADMLARVNRNREEKEEKEEKSGARDKQSPGKEAENGDGPVEEAKNGNGQAESGTPGDSNGVAATAPLGKNLEPALLLSIGPTGIGVEKDGKSVPDEAWKPEAGLDLSWGYWNAAGTAPSSGDAGGVLSREELRYWARVRPADMEALRSFSGEWRFSTPQGSGHFLGHSDTGSLQALQMGFQVDLASGRISDGSFQATAPGQEWRLGFSGQLLGPAARMEIIRDASLVSGGRESPVSGDLQGVFTGTGAADAGFAAGFSLHAGQGASLHGLGLLKGEASP